MSFTLTNMNLKFFCFSLFGFFASKKIKSICIKFTEKDPCIAS
ncbi:hypothetical protein THERMOT_2067 [Bathymodiolus thermophilus thioautotrophic gill symbiont]|nr:hypothetical protein THERMOT_2067 [Bathymodiolus thermophilus thioautotrophic gill symbiont]